MADTTPTPAAPSAAPSTSFWDYLKNFVPQHIMLLGIVAVVVLLIVLFNKISDQEKELAAQQAISATLQQKFQSVGTAAISANSEQQPAQIQQQASDAFGAALMSQMSSNQDKLNSLTTLVGTTQAQLQQLQSQLTPFQSTSKNTTTGALTGYTLEDSRTPPLDSVKLFYDPTQTDPNLAFKGTTWQNYQETFNASIGDWQAKKTGGYSTTVALSRTISKPDPNNPGKMIVVGTEQIPITGSNTIYTPKTLENIVPPVQPRWTVSMGISKGSGSAAYTPSATVDYRLFSRYGIYGGTANGGLVGGVSVQLGGKK